MSEIYKIITQLSNNPGRNDKIRILNEHKNNELLKKVFHAALNPYIQFYIRKIPEYEPFDTFSMKLEGFIDIMLNDIASRAVTGHAAISRVSTSLALLSKEDAEVAKLIIMKDLNCGVAESTVNKVWKDLVPVYPCLLGQPYDDKTIKNISFPAASQCKKDGMRINIHCEDGKVTFFGRSGRPLDLLGYLEKEFAELSKHIPYNCVFDGELILVENGVVMPRQKGNGILNKAIKGTISDKEASLVKATLWDVIPLENFRKGHHKCLYKTRLQTLQDAMLKQPNDKAYELIEHRVVNSIEEAIAHYEECLGRGEEGIMLKNISSEWKGKRSNDLVKMKAEIDNDFIITGWNHGKVGGKWEKHLGSLTCASRDARVQVDVTGLSDELRQEIFENIESYIGKIVTIKHNGRISSSAKEVDSVYLPRIVEFREDKHEADSSTDIK